MLHLRHALRRVPPAGRTAGHRAASTALWRWGLGEGLERTPQRVAEGEGVSAVACGLEHSAFVVDGQLYTFGANADHQLGRASENDAHCAVAKLVAPDGHQPQAQQVALGARHTAVISEGGVLWTCGYGGSFWFGAGALGLNLRGTVPELRMVMPFVQEGTEILQVTCGDMHSLVLDSEGRVYSTGQGFFGALGRGALASTGEELEFKEVVFFRKTTDSILNPGVEPQIVKLDAGREFSAAMSSHGELWVWGKNDYGQLGMGFEVMKSRDFCM
ncbi:Probable E3 ubiquitin-protein ligase HERC3 (HECT domain and RCC1-like domain-containing protein 3) (HECT-type E3 ubiquitin transferase HERC3), partial [Durusdinium trenchii]